MNSFSRRALALFVSILALFLGLAACGDETKAVDSNAVILVRERVAAFVEKDERTRAREALVPLVAPPDAAVEDLIRAAAIEFGDNQTEAARRYLDRATKVSPAAPAIAYLRGQMAREAGDPQAALAFLRSAHAAVPGDLATRIVLGAIEDDLDHQAEAEKLYREVVAVGHENGQVWYVAAVTRLSNLLTAGGRDAEAQPFRAIARDLEKRQIKGPTTLQMLLGELGRVRPPQPTGSVVTRLNPPRFSAEAPILAQLGGATALLARDVDDDLRTDFVAYGPRGTFVALRRGATYDVKTVTSAATDFVLPFDVDNDGDLDLLVLQAARLALFEYRASDFHAAGVAFPTLPSTPSDILAVDYDHEGDLDLLAVGAFGARVWRRDGTPELEKPKGGALFTDASAESGLPSDRAFTWCISEDLDGDNDVDFLLGGSGASCTLDSLRGGHFVQLKGVFENASAIRPVVADLDGDARADLWIAGRPSSFVPRKGDLRASVPAAIRDAHALATADFDLDGALDCAWVDGSGSLAFLFAPGQQIEHAETPNLATGGPLCAADFDGDGRVDCATSDADGVHVFANAGPTAQGKRVSFRGLRDNRRGAGLTFEMRAGTIYRRIFWRGEPEVIGLGSNSKFDVFRATWPNGVGVTGLDLDLSAVDANRVSIFDHVPQPSGQVGSCPFLYTWNGRSNTFVSDVLGITPLGLPMEPGLLVPPDHDEYVLVKGEQLAARDGVFELQFTEELREVTYLDHAKLLVVDHPADTEIFPNERFTFPPFPVAHVHTVKHALTPTIATGSDGRDWTRELATIDDSHAVPFTLQPAQFAGLAHPWFVELAFDKDEIANAKKLRLLMTGWFFWSDASANMASARNPETPFIPPILQVPDGQGGWRDAGPPVGFPAGKTKTMVIDVGDVLRKDDPRIRVFTSLRLYWDALRLAVDEDDAPLTTHEIACSSAKLWRRGFSAPLEPGTKPGMANADDLPERFDWNVLDTEPRWNQHPGLYTRYGECRELVDTVDDRFVILGSGDALTLRFDAHSLAPVAKGMRRDYLLYLDGWAKDRDPNTIQALEVEPLPFHAMSGYPYGKDEHFPDDDRHRAWRREWNTRTDWEWIRPVAPSLESAWLETAERTLSK